MLEFFSPGDVQYITDNLDRFMQNTSQPAAMEVRFRHKDGSWRVIEGVTNNMVNDPTVMGFVVNARDITERKQAEEKLRNSERYFWSLIQNALDAMVVIGKDGLISFAGPSLEPARGYKPEEIVGINGFSEIHPDDMPIAINVYNEVMQHPDTPIRTEVRVRHDKDGRDHTRTFGVVRDLLRLRRKFGIRNALVIVGEESLAATCKEVLDDLMPLLQQIRAPVLRVDSARVIDICAEATSAARWIVSTNPAVQRLVNDGMGVLIPRVGEDAEVVTKAALSDGGMRPEWVPAVLSLSDG